jgi:hypothetical protein
MTMELSVANYTARLVVDGPDERSGGDYVASSSWTACNSSDARSGL